MKYFGKRSLSSILKVFLQVCWYPTLALAVLAPFAASGIIFLSTPQGDAWMNQMKTYHADGVGKATGGSPSSACANDLSGEDARDWQAFKNTHPALKILLIPYIEAVLILLLFLIRKSRLLFSNFTQDIVFDKRNVPLLSTISKLNIAVGIMTFSLSTLLISVVLFLLCEMIKTGAVLKEEHDLTI